MGSHANVVSCNFFEVFNYFYTFFLLINVAKCLLWVCHFVGHRKIFCFIKTVLLNFFLYGIYIIILNSNILLDKLILDFLALQYIVCSLAFFVYSKYAEYICSRIHFSPQLWDCSMFTVNWYMLWSHGGKIAFFLVSWHDFLVYVFLS